MKTKWILLALVALLSGPFSKAAIGITISGSCVTGSILLTKSATLQNGKNYYSGTGTIAGNANVPIIIYWNLNPTPAWNILFGGRTYYTNALDVTKPPSTSSYTWNFITGNPVTCTVASPLTLIGDVLPVELNGFTASKTGFETLLKWNTASEKSNKGFHIERSPEGAQWNEIGFAQGAGTTVQARNYNFTDVAPLSGANYYRLKQEDFDGGFQFSPIVGVEFTFASDYSIAPNPTQGLLRVYIKDGQNSPASAILVDVTGRQLISKVLGAQTSTLDLSALPPGAYFLEISNGAQVHRDKIVKW